MLSGHPPLVADDMVALPVSDVGSAGRITHNFAIIGQRFAGMRAACKQFARARSPAQPGSDGAAVRDNDKGNSDVALHEFGEVAGGCGGRRRFDQWCISGDD